MGTFNTINDYIVIDEIENPKVTDTDANGASEDQPPIEAHSSSEKLGIGLRYNINVVLPDTSDITVYNAIFKSIKDNLL